MGEQESELWRGVEGKVVMVTGASSGIGYEFCVDLAKAGCKIIAAARRVQRLNMLCQHINQLSSRHVSSCPTQQAVAVELDVSSDAESIRAAVGRAWDAFGRIDALINNAGVRGNVKSCLELSEDEWNNTLKTNLTGAWLVSKYVGIRMRDSSIEGSIINISSVVGLNRVQFHGGAAYVSSKAALNYLTNAMAIELGVYNIRVNVISPGLFKSEITQPLMEKKWIQTFTRKTVPLKELGEVDPALTSLVRYLIHETSRYVTGNNFIVDSGLTLTGVPIFLSL